MHQLDRTSSDAEPAACWLSVYNEVADGTPPGDLTTWEASTCITDLVQRMLEDEAKSDGVVQQSSSGNSSEKEGVQPLAILAVVLIPVFLITCAIATCMVLWFLREQRLEKMMMTDEIWDAGGQDRTGKVVAAAPRPPTGRFKLREKGTSFQLVTADNSTTSSNSSFVSDRSGTGSDCGNGDSKLSRFLSPKRVFTDVSMDEDYGVVGSGWDLEAASPRGGEENEEEEDFGDGSMIYPMAI